MELKKYDALKKGIEENLAMQAQLLGLIGSQQGVYKSTFAIAEWRQSCEVCGEPYSRGRFECPHAVTGYRGQDHEAVQPSVFKVAIMFANDHSFSTTHENGHE